MRVFPHRRAWFIVLLTSALLATGCGSSAPNHDIAEGATAQGFPVTVTNCGVTTTFHRPPTRAVALNQHAIENLLALGLEKSMRGTAHLDDRILPEYQAAYDTVPVLAQEYPSYESLLAAEPDFGYGPGSAGRRVHDLNLAITYCDRICVLDAGQVVALGVPAYVLTLDLIAEVYGLDADITQHPRMDVPQITVIPRVHT